MSSASWLSEESSSREKVPEGQPREAQEGIGDPVVRLHNQKHRSSRARLRMASGHEVRATQRFPLWLHPGPPKEADPLLAAAGSLGSLESPEFTQSQTPRRPSPRAISQHSLEEAVPNCVASVSGTTVLRRSPGPFGWSIKIALLSCVKIGVVECNFSSKGTFLKFVLKV